MIFEITGNISFIHYSPEYFFYGKDMLIKESILLKSSGLQFEKKEKRIAGKILLHSCCRKIYNVGTN
jgi:hypothetical protein